MLDSSLHLVLRDAYRLSRMLSSTLNVPTVKCFLMQMCALVTAFIGFYALMPLVRGEAYTDALWDGQTINLIGLTFQVEVPFFLPFALVAFAVWLLYQGKKREFDVMPVVSARLRLDYGDVYSELERRESRALNKAVRTAAAVMRWFLVVKIEAVKLAAGVVGIILIDYHALMPFLIAIMVPILLSSRKSESTKEIAPSDDGELLRFIRFRMRLNKSSLTFGNLMPTFLLLTLIWDRLLINEPTDTANLLFLCVLVAFCGNTASRISQSLLRMAESNQTWRRFQYVDIAADAETFILAMELNDTHEETSFDE